VLGCFVESTFSSAYTKLATVLAEIVLLFQFVCFFVCLLISCACACTNKLFIVRVLYLIIHHVYVQLDDTGCMTVSSDINWLFRVILGS
jgi:hypothetical protein